MQPCGPHCEREADACALQNASVARAVGMLSRIALERRCHRLRPDRHKLGRSRGDAFASIDYPGLVMSVGVGPGLLRSQAGPSLLGLPACHGFCSPTTCDWTREPNRSIRAPPRRSSCVGATQRGGFPVRSGMNRRTNPTRVLFLDLRVGRCWSVGRSED